MSAFTGIRSTIAAIGDQIDRVRIYRRLADRAGALSVSARRRLGIVD